MADKITTSNMRNVPVGKTEAEAERDEAVKASQQQFQQHQQSHIPDTDTLTQRNRSQDTVKQSDPIHTATPPTAPHPTVAAFELAVAGEPLHKMRRYLELIQSTSVELPNSEPLAALLITVRQAIQQLFTVPTQMDDTP